MGIEHNMIAIMDTNNRYSNFTVVHSLVNILLKKECDYCIARDGIRTTEEGRRKKEERPSLWHFIYRKHSADFVQG